MSAELQEVRAAIPIMVVYSEPGHNWAVNLQTCDSANMQFACGGWGQGPGGDQRQRTSSPMHLPFLNRGHDWLSPDLHLRPRLMDPYLGMASSCPAILV